MPIALSLPDRHFAHSQYGPGRMAHIRYRTRLMALMGAGVTVGLLPNELFLGKDVDYSMLTGFRLAMAGALFFGALAVRRAPQTALATLTGTLGVFLLFLANFFLFPLGLLDHPPAVLATAYTITPLVIIGITGIFPLLLVEGVCLVAVVGSFFGGGILAGLVPPQFNLPQAVWSGALLGLGVLWMQGVTLRSLAACDFSLRTDSLSGTYNRRATDESGERALSAGDGLSVLFIDIDHFKPLNDRYGHACGDHVIHYLGQLLLENTRGEDTVGRIGGEEFLFLAPHTTIKEAKGLAERLRKTLADNPPVCDGTEVPFTVSIGIAESTAGDSFDELVKRADEAMYAAKEAGRDRLRVAESAGNRSPYGSAS